MSTITCCPSPRLVIPDRSRAETWTTRPSRRYPDTLRVIRSPVARKRSSSSSGAAQYARLKLAGLDDAPAQAPLSCKPRNSAGPLHDATDHRPGRTAKAGSTPPMARDERVRAASRPNPVVADHGEIGAHHAARLATRATGRGKRHRMQARTASRSRFNSDHNTAPDDQTQLRSRRVAERHRRCGYHRANNCNRTVHNSKACW
jgi:hypothetical protein